MTADGGRNEKMIRMEDWFGGGPSRPYENPPLAPKAVGGFGFERPRNGETNDWLTPPRLVRLLGEFDLDPCGCPGMPWRLAKRTYFPPEENGLLLPWEGRVFCNPPYGYEFKAWVQRMADHGDGILLIFARTETETWKWAWEADAFLFPTGRISFFRKDGKRAGSGTAPSALIAYGQRNVDALGNSHIIGAYLGRAKVKGSVKVSSL